LRDRIRLVGNCGGKEVKPVPPVVTLVLDRRDKYHKIFFNSYPLDRTLKRGEGTSEDLVVLMKDAMSIMGFDVIVERWDE
jgi:hypothetical protein